MHPYIMWMPERSSVTAAQWYISGWLPGTKQCMWQRFIRAGCSHYSLRPEHSCWFLVVWIQSIAERRVISSSLATKINHTQQQQQGMKTKQEAKLDQEPNQQQEQTRKKEVIHVNIPYSKTHLLRLTHKVRFGEKAGKMVAELKGEWTNALHHHKSTNPATK